MVREKAYNGLSLPSTMASKRIKNLSLERIEEIGEGYKSGKSPQETRNRTNPRPYLDARAKKRGFGNHRVYAFLNRKPSPNKKRNYSQTYEPSTKVESIIEKIIEEREEIEICLGALKKVNPFYLDLVLRRVIEGQSFKRIGGDLRKSSQRVHIQYHEAIDCLRRIYTNRNRED